MSTKAASFITVNRLASIARIYRPKTYPIILVLIWMGGTNPQGASSGCVTFARGSTP